MPSRSFKAALVDVFSQGEFENVLCKNDKRLLTRVNKPVLKLMSYKKTMAAWHGMGAIKGTGRQQQPQALS